MPRPKNSPVQAKTESKAKVQIDWFKEPVVTALDDGFYTTQDLWRRERAQPVDARDYTLLHAVPHGQNYTPSAGYFAIVVCGGFAVGSISKATFDEAKKDETFKSELMLLADNRPEKEPYVPEKTRNGRLVDPPRQPARAFFRPSATGVIGSPALHLGRAHIVA